MSEQSTLRPLKRKAGGGIQEMTDADIQDLCGYIIGSYLVTNSVYGAASGVGPSGWIQFNQPTALYYTTENDVVDSGTINNRRPVFVTSGNDAIASGQHPVSTSDNTSIPTGVLLTKTITKSLSNFLTARPVTYLKDSNLLEFKAPYTWTAPAYGFPSYRIMEMTDQMIVWYIGSAITSMMSAGGIGGYYLGSGLFAPEGGTWVKIEPNISDTFVGASGVTTTNYALWRKSSGTAGTIRPLKRSGANLVEMTDTEIQNMWPCVGEYIRQTTGSIVRGIGSYYVSVTAPTTGTWVSRGTFVDVMNDLVDTGYNGSFTGTFVGTYNQAFVGVYASTFTRTIAGFFTAAFGSPPFTNVFTGAFTGEYAGSYTNVYTGISYQGVSYTGSFQGTTYVGTYLSAGSSKSTYGMGGGKNPAGVTYTSYYAETNYTGYYTVTFAGTYTKTWTASWTRAWTGSYAGTYNQSFTALFSAAFSSSYVGVFTGAYTGAFSGSYTRAFTGSYAGAYTRAFSGLTVQSTTNSITYTLWVRTA